MERNVLRGDSYTMYTLPDRYYSEYDWPLGTPPPWGERLVQNIEWLTWPPPLNFIAGSNEIAVDMSPVLNIYKR